jgi:hypothetical protein
MNLNFSNALAGAGTGAALGSLVPGIGTGLGAVGGGLLGLLDFGGPKQDQMKRVSTVSPQQQGILNSIAKKLGMMGNQGSPYDLAQSRLASLLDPSSDAYAAFEDPYMRQFNDQIIPMLAERFAGMGAQGGALSSSGFGQALGTAGAGLQSNLASLRAQLQNQAANTSLSQYNNLAGLGLGIRPFENVYQPGSAGLFGNALSGIAGGVGSGLGMGLGSKLSGSLFGNQLG